MPRREINIMIDSPSITKEWIEALNRNQATGRVGAVGRDGVWRYPDGKPLESLSGGSGNAFQRIGGVVGAVKRARGTGGF